MRRRWPATGRVIVVAGGADRTASVRLALAAALGESDVDVVLVHDAARALTPPALIRSVADAVRAGAPAVVPVLPVTDTVKRVDADRDRRRRPSTATDLRAVQTPQGFAPDVLRRAVRRGRRTATPTTPAWSKPSACRCRRCPGDPRGLQDHHRRSTSRSPRRCVPGPA